MAALLLRQNKTFPTKSKTAHQVIKQIALNLQQNSHI